MELNRMSNEDKYSFSYGEVVWTKLGKCWWPGEICEESLIPDDLLASQQKKKYIAVVKFFNENTFEFVRDAKKIFPYNCEKKHDFIKKGLDLYRAKNKFMVKFPEDISNAERKTKGDVNILSNVEFSQKKKNNYSNIFNQPPKTPRKKKNQNETRGQKPAIASTSKTSLEKEKTEGTPSGFYKCHLCPYSTNRVNTIVYHTRQHTNDAKTKLKDTLKRDSNSNSTQTFKRHSQANNNTRLSTISITSTESVSSSNSSVTYHLKCGEEEEAEEEKDLQEIECVKETPEELAESPGIKEPIGEKKIKDKEQITKAILADWTDDEDDDCVVINEMKAIDDEDKQTEKALDIKESQESNHSKPKVSLINADSTTNISFKKNQTMTLNFDKTKAALKYRNIPKKDRRDVVLKEFNNGHCLSVDNSNGFNNENNLENIIINSSEENDKIAGNTSNSVDENLSQMHNLDKESKCVVLLKKPPKDFRSSISCFDFKDEEDDFLTTINKLKKKYMQAEKSKENESSDPIKADEENRDLQLSNEIENLLNETKPSEIQTTTSNVYMPSEVFKEDQTLTPKERGKRIFKSRNKSKNEDSSGDVDKNIETTAVSEQTITESVSDQNQSKIMTDITENVQCDSNNDITSVKSDRAVHNRDKDEKIEENEAASSGDTTQVTTTSHVKDDILMIDLEKQTRTCKINLNIKKSQMKTVLKNVNYTEHTVQGSDTKNIFKKYNSDETPESTEIVSSSSNLMNEKFNKFDRKSDNNIFTGLAEKESVLDVAETLISFPNKLTKIKNKYLDIDSSTNFFSKGKKNHTKVNNSDPIDSQSKSEQILVITTSQKACVKNNEDIQYVSSTEDSPMLNFQPVTNINAFDPLKITQNKSQCENTKIDTKNELDIVEILDENSQERSSDYSITESDVQNSFRTEENSESSAQKFNKTIDYDEKNSRKRKTHMKITPRKRVLQQPIKLDLSANIKKFRKEGVFHRNCTETHANTSFIKTTDNSNVLYPKRDHNEIDLPKDKKQGDIKIDTKRVLSPEIIDCDEFIEEDEQEGFTKIVDSTTDTKITREMACQQLTNIIKMQKQNELSSNKNADMTDHISSTDNNYKYDNPYIIESKAEKCLSPSQSENSDDDLTFVSNNSKENITKGVSDDLSVKKDDDKEKSEIITLQENDEQHALYEIQVIPSSKIYNSSLKLSKDIPQNSGKCMENLCFNLKSDKAEKKSSTEDMKKFPLKNVNARIFRKRKSNSQERISKFLEEGNNEQKNSPSQKVIKIDEKSENDSVYDIDDMGIVLANDLGSENLIKTQEVNANNADESLQYEEIFSITTEPSESRRLSSPQSSIEDNIISSEESLVEVEVENCSNSLNQEENQIEVDEKTSKSEEILKLIAQAKLTNPNPIIQTNQIPIQTNVSTAAERKGGLISSQTIIIPKYDQMTNRIILPSISFPKEKIIQASTGGQIVITSKGTVITTNSNSVVGTAKIVSDKLITKGSTQKCDTSLASTMANYYSNFKVVKDELSGQKSVIQNFEHSNVKSHYTDDTSSQECLQSNTTQASTSKPIKREIIKMSPQKFTEMSKLGYIQEKHGKILTTTGFKQIKQQKLISRKNIVKDDNELTVEATSSDNPAIMPIMEIPIEHNRGLKKSFIDISSSQLLSEQMSNVQTPFCQTMQSEQIIKHLSEQSHVDLTAKYGEGNLLAVPSETFGGPPNSFFLCTIADNEAGFLPIDNQPLYLDASNQLVPINSTKAISISDNSLTNEDYITEETDHVLTGISQLSDDSNQTFLINTADGHHILLDQQSILALVASANDGAQIVTSDGQQLNLTPELLSSFGIDQQNELSEEILLTESVDLPIQTQNQDILAAALAGTEVYHQEQIVGDVLQIDSPHSIQIVDQGLAYQPMTQTATAQTNETNAILTQPPIMSTLEVPSNNRKSQFDCLNMKNSSEIGMISQNLDASLAIIGVTTQSSTVPSSLELPITITNPAIAPKSTNSMSLNTLYSSDISQTKSISPQLNVGNDHNISYEVYSTAIPIRCENRTINGPIECFTTIKNDDIQNKSINSELTIMRKNNDKNTKIQEPESSGSYDDTSR